LHKLYTLAEGEKGVKAMSERLKACAALIIALLLDIIVRRTAPQLKPILWLADFSTIMAMIFYVARHGIHDIELVLFGIGNLFRHVCCFLLMVRCTIRDFMSLWQSPEHVADRPCLCGSGRLSKSCHLRRYEKEGIARS